MIFFLDVFADKNHVALRLSFTDVQALNYLLRSEIFVSEDGQLRAAHLILDYEPLSRIFQDVGQAIRVRSLRLARIDISKPGFLARRDLPPIVLSSSDTWKGDCLILFIVRGGDRQIQF